MTRKFLVALVLLMAFTSLYAQEETMRIAVFDLTAKSPQVEADSAMLSEMLRNEFIKTGRFEVVSREQTAKIMAEAEFQSGGLTSESDAIKIGQLLNVRRAIVGSVGVLGDTVFVTVQLFDLETGRFITAESMEAPSMKDIVSRMKGTVAVLTDAVYGTKAAVASTPTPAAAPAVEPAPKATPEAVPKARVVGSYPRIINYVGYGLAAVGAGMAATGYFYYDAQAVDAYNTALAAKAAYDGASYDANYRELWTAYTKALATIEPLTTWRNGAYIAGGVLGACGIILAVLPPPKVKAAGTGRFWSLAALPSGFVATVRY